MLHESGINIYYTRSFFAKQISCKGLYKKFELSPVNYRPIGCPGLQSLNGFELVFILILQPIRRRAMPMSLEIQIL